VKKMKNELYRVWSRITIYLLVLEV
jgi:hypothetical protein